MLCVQVVVVGVCVRMLVWCEDVGVYNTCVYVDEGCCKRSEVDIGSIAPESLLVMCCLVERQTLNQ